ncbi:MAG: NAD(P)/FAD-dependent oxidoreductase, partial [Pseudomonadales bacterium]|nr:NAD(P)/FAD-dependent oxidoreductase [Pseudomonadales bacterium]
MNEKLCSVVIIGAGFSGMCMAIQLKKSGFDDFIVLEEADEVGGTWRENTYPGAECDIPSALYSYSFEHNAKWRYKWSGQEQILDYQKGIAKKYGLYAHIRFNQHVCAAKYCQAETHWVVDTKSGERYFCQHLVSAVGQLHIPSIPEFANANSYQGTAFHSARWNHAIDLSGKRVAVIGNAASALQFIPQIAPRVKHLTVFQRSPNWVIAKRDRRYSRFEQWISEKIPWVTRMYRLRLWLRGELLLLPAMRRNRLARWLLRRETLASLRQHIKDPAIIDKLTPAYPVGAKRILFSDDYYQALARDNVKLDTAGVKQFTEQGIV